MKTITVTVPADEIGCYSGPYSIVNERVTHQMSEKQIEALKFLVDIAGYHGRIFNGEEQFRIEKKVKEAQRTLGIDLFYIQRRR